MMQLTYALMLCDGGPVAGEHRAGILVFEFSRASRERIQSLGMPTWYRMVPKTATLNGSFLERYGWKQPHTALYQNDRSYSPLKSGRD